MNFVSMVAARLDLIDPDVMVFRRKLYNTDPAQAIGVAAENWSPNPQSYEMLGQGTSEPSINRYDVAVQCLIKDSDEQRGIAVSSKLSKMVRGILLADPPLRDSLRVLSSKLYGVTERTLKWSVPSQRYLSQELSGQFVYLSTIQVQLETESTHG